MIPLLDTLKLFATPEHSLLLSAMGATHHQRAQQAPTSDQPIDWVTLLDIADTHGLTPLLHIFLAKDPHSAPDTLLDQLNDRFRANALRNRILTQELVDILTLFDAQNITALAYKGPSLTLLAYKNLDHRQFGDLDILVKTEQVPLACDLLRQRNYQRSIPTLTPTQENDYIRTDHEHEFISPDQLVHIDLHWSLSTRRFPFKTETDNLFERAQICQWNKQTINTIGSQDMLLLLCMHANKDLWRKLVWICDIDRFIRMHDSIDWELLVVNARTSQCEKMLYIALLISHDILNTPVPVELLNKARSEPLIAHGNQVIQASLVAAKPERTFLQCLAIQPYILPLCDTWSIRFSYIAHTLVTPTECDMMKLRLPRKLHFIYYIITPIRKLSFCVTRFFKRLILN